LAGLVVGVVFVRRQQRLADPLLDLRLFRSPAFSASLTTNLLSFFVGFGALLFVAQYLQLVLGLSPLAAGLWLLPCGCQIFGPYHATCAYSWINPPSRSRRRTLPADARTAGPSGSSGGACPNARWGRCTL